MTLYWECNWLQTYFPCFKQTYNLKNCISWWQVLRRQTELMNKCQTNCIIVFAHGLRSANSHGNVKPQVAKPIIVIRSITYNPFFNIIIPFRCSCSLEKYNYKNNLLLYTFKLFFLNELSWNFQDILDTSCARKVT